MPGPFSAAVPAPANRAAPGGLVALAVRPPDVDPRWEAGFGFAPESCGDGVAVAVVCEYETAKLPDGNPDLVSYLPFAVIGSDQCTTLDAGRDREGRARRHLLAVQSYQVERVFWTGNAVDDPNPGEDRPHLADGRAEILVSGAPVPLVDGFVLLEQVLTECLHGQPGMVHVTPGVRARLAAADLIVERNGVWSTPAGHTVVAGSGYTGGGPRPTVGGALPAAPNLAADPPADQWVYGTGPVHVLLGDVAIYDDVDRAINTETWRAEQAAAAFFGCCQIGVQLDLDGTS